MLLGGSIGVWGLLLAPIALVKRFRWALIFLLIGLSLFALRVHEIHQLPIGMPKEVAFEATLNSSFTPIKQKVRGSYLSSQQFTASATLNRLGTVSLHIPIRVIVSHEYEGIPSELILGRGRVIPSRDRSLGALVISPSIHQLRAANLAQRIAHSFRISFLHIAKVDRNESSALIPGMVLGDTSLQSDEFVKSMQKSGLTHLTAVSGENFAIIAMVTLALLRRLMPRRYLLRHVVLALCLLAFLILVGPSPSVLRASVMTGTLLLSQIRGSQSHSLNSLALAVAILLILNPFQAQSFGFALSVAATAGIILFAKRLEKKVPELIAIPLAATIACAPIIVLLSGQLSWTTLPANIAASLAVTPITILGLISALISPFAPTVAGALFGAAEPFAWWITEVAHIGSSPSALYLPRSLLGAAIPLLFIYLIFKKRWIIVGLMAISAIGALLLPHSAWPGGNWRVVNCDVGQGDGLVIRAEERSAIVIDVGPDPEAMDSCLKALHINRIPLLVLTHFHADHVTGLARALKGRRVGMIWTSHFHEPLSEFSQVLSLTSGIPMRSVETGESYRVAGVDIEVLSGGVPTSSLVNGSSINNSSVALTIHQGALSIFAGGDSEPEEQAAILQSGRVKRVDILKVSHHGSRNQYLPLLDALVPRIALISVGRGNMYGHPSPVLIKALSQRHIRTFRTDFDGAIAIDAQLHERSLKSHWWSIAWK